MSESIEVQTASGIAVYEQVDNTPARTNKTAMARIESLRSSFEEVSTDRMPTNHFMQLLATRFMDEPRLLNCSFQSIVRAAMQCHAWGLDPTGKRNGAFLIAYKGDCQLQLGYGAMIDLVTREGQIEAIRTGIVYDEDEFDPIQGSTNTLRHAPNVKGSRRGRSDGIAYYAVARFKSGYEQFDWMTREQVEDVRKQFGGPGPAWKNSYDQMAVKTVIHRLCKTLPVNTMASQALAYVEKSEYQVSASATEPEFTEEERRAIRERQTGGLPQESTSGDAGNTTTIDPDDVPGPDGLSKADKAAIVAEERREAQLQAKTDGKLFQTPQDGQGSRR